MRRDPATLTMAAVSAAASVGGGLLANSRTPKMPSPVQAPDPQDPATKLARQRELEKQQAGKGYMGTILANDSRPTSLLQEARSAPTYENQTLGKS